MTFDIDMDKMMIYGGAILATLLFLSSLRKRDNETSEQHSGRVSRTLFLLAAIGGGGAVIYYYYMQMNPPMPRPPTSYYAPRLMTSYKPGHMCRYRVE